MVRVLFYSTLNRCLVGITLYLILGSWFPSLKEITVMEGSFDLGCSETTASPILFSSSHRCFAYTFRSEVYSILMQLNCLKMLVIVAFTSSTVFWALAPLTITILFSLRRLRPFSSGFFTCRDRIISPSFCYSLPNSHLSLLQIDSARLLASLNLPRDDLILITS